MPITTAQRERRKNHLGSSDVSAICGLDPFRNEYDVWLEKTGQLDPERSNKPWLQMGNDFESVILNRAERALGALRRNQFRSLKSEGIPVASHIDAIVVATGEPVEAKSCGVFWPVEEQWGDPGTDQVPDRVVLQSQIHMAVTKKSVCHVPALFWGLKQELYEVPRDDEMLGDLLDYLTTWWERHVIKREPPENHVTPSLEILKRVRREPDSVIDLSGNPDIDRLVFEWQQAGLHKKEAEDEQDERKAEIITLLGNAEAALLGDGRMLTFLEQSFGPKVRAKDLKVDMPEIFAKYGHDSRGRVLRVKQAKREKFNLDIFEEQSDGERTTETKPT